MNHFPLGYLVMGKNVFSQINDMFIQKEVATLFRSPACSYPCKSRHSERDAARSGPVIVAEDQGLPTQCTAKGKANQALAALAYPKPCLSISHCKY